MKLLKFYADWCNPCKQMNPIVDDYISESNSDIVLEPIDISNDDNKDLVEKYGIKTIPTLVLVDESGNTIQSVIGRKTKAELFTLFSLVS